MLVAGSCVTGEGHSAELYDPIAGSGASASLQHGDTMPSDPDAEVYYPAGYSAGGG